MKIEWLNIYILVESYKPMGSQLSLAYQVETGPTSLPLYRGWARNPSIGDGIQKPIHALGI